MTKRKVPISQHVTTATKMRRFYADMSGDEHDAVDDLITFLEWCKNNEDAIKTGALIQRDEAVRKVKAAFPDAELQAVRRMNEDYDD